MQTTYLMSRVSRFHLNISFFSSYLAFRSLSLIVTSLSLMDENANEASSIWLSVLRPSNAILAETSLESMQDLSSVRYFSLSSAWRRIFSTVFQ